MSLQTGGMAQVLEHVHSKLESLRPGTREKVRLKRINLEGNTHAQEINVSQCPV
jgi:hypothetical protein